MRRIHSSLFGSLLLLACLAAVPAFAWSDCDHRAERDARVSVDGVKRVVVVGRAGDLDVRAGSVSDIVARGVACADKRSHLEQTRIAVERAGEVVRIVADVPDTSGWNSAVWLDLDVEIPEDLEVSIEDSSGDLSASGIWVVRLDDSSGDVDLRDTRGDLRLDDSSGDVTLRHHRGDVTLSDSSGDLRLRDVEGTITVDRDSSGDVYADGVTGSVIVRVDSSGDIRVSEVGGDFEVHRDGSGDVDYRDVQGRVDVPADR